MAEDKFLIGTNCTSYDPNKIQCDKQADLPIHQLNKYCEDNDTRYDIYPATVIQAIFNGRTGTRLDRILAMCNNTYLTWEGTFADTINKLGKEYRRKGYIITYRDETNTNWTQRYNSDDISDNAWINPSNWEGWSFDTILEDLLDAIKEIFNNIGDYKEFLDILNAYIQKFVIDVFNNINNYPQLINIIKNSTLEGLPIVLKEIFNNINEYPELKEIFNQYIKQWVETVFNNIDSYPALTEFITNAINNKTTEVLNNIFNNINNYPDLKNIIINASKEQLTNIFNNLDLYPDIKNKLQELINNRINYIFTHLDEFPDLVSLISESVCVCIKNIFNNISSYPVLITCINNATNSRVDYIFNNISSFPILENLITNKIIDRVTYIFNNVNNFPSLVNTIKTDIEYIFNNLSSYPNFKLVVENKIDLTIQDILTNIDNYPNIKTNFTSFINSIINTRRGIANGIASLDSNGLIPSSQLPSYVDDVLDGYYIDSTHFAENYIDDQPVYYIPESGKIYVDISENTEYSGKTYRWSGTIFVEISKSIVIGEILGTAYDGSKGKENRDSLNSIPQTIIQTINNFNASISVGKLVILKSIKSGLIYAPPVEDDVIIPNATKTAVGLMTPELIIAQEKVITDFEELKNSVYTKTEIDNKIYNKDQLYTKAEVDKAIADAIAGFKLSIIPEGFELVIKEKTT